MVKFRVLSISLDAVVVACILACGDLNLIAMQQIPITFLAHVPCKFHRNNLYISGLEG